jgi:hypothetical protein
MKASTIVLATASVAASVAVGAPSAFAFKASNGLARSPKLHARTTQLTRTAAYKSLTSQGLYQVAVHTILAG